MVRVDHLDQLRRWEKILGAGVVDGLIATSRTDAAFILGAPRPGMTGKKSMVYIFVGKQPADFERLARQFLQAPSPFDLLPGRP
jgi:hypothetical protein